MLPAFEAFRPRHGALLVARDATAEWIGCMPVHRPPRWRRVPLPALASWRHIYCFLAHPLLAPGREVEAATALLRGAMESCRTFVAIDELPDPGPAREALGRAASALGIAPRTYERHIRAAYYRPDPERGVTLSRKHEREMARLGRRLSEELGAPLEVADRAGDHAAVDRFLEIEVSGWKGREGTAFASIPGHADLFREWCRRFAAADRLQLLSLEVAGTPVAMKCNLFAGEWVVCFKIAFDERWSRFSPGILLEVENARLFDQSSGPAAMDSCAAPDNAMINRLWRGRRGLSALALPVPGLRAPAVEAAIMLGAKLNLAGKGSTGDEAARN